MSANGKIAGRFFLVGAARSGTTLLQAMIASHSRVFSFAESHFFCHAFPRGRRYRWLGLAQPKKARSAMGELLQLINRPDLVHLVPRHSPFFRTYSKSFVQALDKATLDAGKDIWLEKTPHHVGYLPVISRRVPGAQFIHLLRDGRDVLASQCHAQAQDPAYWGNWSIERLVALWNQDIQTSLAFQGGEAHILVSYERLLDCPQLELKRLCGFMGLDFEPAMLEHWRVADTVVGFRRHDPWMAKAYEPLQDTRLKKYLTVFSQEQRDYIAAHLLWGGQIGTVLESTSPTAAGHLP